MVSHAEHPRSRFEPTALLSNTSPRGPHLAARRQEGEEEEEEEEDTYGARR